MEPATDIVIGSFEKIDLRVGTITRAERIEKSEKLLKLEVFFGESGTRTIVGGIGRAFDPVGVLGKQVVVVFNLVPRKVMGIESHGMLLAAPTSTGGLVLASCPGAPDGARLG